ncbi:hypothetical protein R1sor_009808 [Riccia sorocarpa]|uniref:Uncharacterized protein n=1 Tax=Riccia sorocarpa TaxID=122646 RepID=A0ABD3HW58_9MARC
MASWLWEKLRSFLLPEDVRTSRKLVASLSLPLHTSQFVHALTDSRNPSSSVVYLLSVERLSERSIADIRSVVGAIRPNSVVALVDESSIPYVIEEEKLLHGSEESLHVPTSALGVVQRSFLEVSKASVYESRAALRFLISVFGTTFHGTTIAAKKAAEDAKATFEFFCFPFTANAALVKEEVEAERGPVDVETNANESPLDFLASVWESFLTGLHGEDTVENLLDTTRRVAGRSLSISYPQEMKGLAPSLTAILRRSQVPILAVTADAESISAPDEVEQISPEELEAECPSFALPFYPVFIDLNSLYSAPMFDVALTYVRSILQTVNNGDEVKREDLAHARLFRILVEAVRCQWNNVTPATSSQPVDFSQLPYDEKCYALLAQGLKQQGEKCKTVVAIVDASSVPLIRKHWNTVLPPEVKEYAEQCLVPLASTDLDEGSSLLGHINLEKPETKAAVVVSAGAAAAVGIVSLPSVSTAIKILTFKVPTVLKIFLLQTKRSALIALSKVITPASNAVVPALKAVGSGKAAVAPSGALKAVALKGAASAEKARAAAHSMVTAAERASLQAIRTSFYSLMKNRQGKIMGPRPWLMLAGSLTTATAIWCYADEIEHGLGIVPAAPGLAKLGRGLEKLDVASNTVQEIQDPSVVDTRRSAVVGKRSWKSIHRTAGGPGKSTTCFPS